MIKHLIQQMTQQFDELNKLEIDTLPNVQIANLIIDKLAIELGSVDAKFVVANMEISVSDDVWNNHKDMLLPLIDKFSVFASKMVRNSQHVYGMYWTDAIRKGNLSFTLKY